MAGVTLREGRDVVVPQFLGRLEFVGELQTLADEVGVAFVEIVLLDEIDRAKARIAARAAGPMSQAQLDAHELLESTGGLDTIPELHHRLRQVIEMRPATKVVRPVLGDVEQTYAEMLALI